jgi:hypothetical protein
MKWGKYRAMMMMIRYWRITIIAPYFPGKPLWMVHPPAMGSGPGGPWYNSRQQLGGKA